MLAFYYKNITKSLVAILFLRIFAHGIMSHAMCSKLTNCITKNRKGAPIWKTIKEAILWTLSQNATIRKTSNSTMFITTRIGFTMSRPTLLFGTIDEMILWMKQTTAPQTSQCVARLFLCSSCPLKHVVSESWIWVLATHTQVIHIIY